MLAHTTPLTPSFIHEHTEYAEIEYKARALLGAAWHGRTSATRQALRDPALAMALVHGFLDEAPGAGLLDEYLTDVIRLSDELPPGGPRTTEVFYTRVGAYLAGLDDGWVSLTSQ